MTRKARNRPPAPPRADPPPAAQPVALWCMVALSGFACLVYQILWMRQLGLLLGNTSQAAALTLAVFFGGLATGSAFWGGRCQRIANPLRAYAWLEAGIAAWGLSILFAPGLVEGSKNTSPVARATRI